MKMKRFLGFTAAALLAVGMLALGGCKETAENEVDARLVGTWSNNAAGVDLKTFTIQLNGSFSATLTNTIGAVGMDEQGTVTGVLVKEGSEYMMNDMRETTGKSWGNSVGAFNGEYVKITLSNDNNSFDLTCEGNITVDDFFGGTYYKQP